MGDTNGAVMRDVAMVRSYIEQWCERHIGQVLPVTNRKDYGLIEFWDDRCVQVIPNTGIAVVAPEMSEALARTGKP
jgi:hypothetical protein